MTPTPLPPKRGRPKIHPDRKKYQAEWIKKKRAALRLLTASAPRVI